MNHTGNLDTHRDPVRRQTPQSVERGVAGQIAQYGHHHPIGGKLVCCSCVLTTAREHREQHQGTITLRGTVRDSGTAAPVSGVAVFLDVTAISRTTDSSGCFTLSGIERGRHTLLLMKTGYSPRAGPVVR